MAELVAMFVVGAVLGGLIVAAWRSENQAWIKDGVLHFDGPLSLEDAAKLKEMWINERSS